MPYTLSFETQVLASPEEAWAWITSFDGISKEMAPYLRMSAPKTMRNLASISFSPNVPLFVSWVRLFGIIPIDYSQLTLESREPGVGFVEQSPMGSMKLWRHARTIISEPSGCCIRDELTFEPRFASGLVFKIIRAFFSHRHRMLARHLGDGGSTQG